MAVRVGGWDTPLRLGHWRNTVLRPLSRTAVGSKLRVSLELVACPHSGLCERAEVVGRPHIQEIPHLPTNRKIPLDPILNDSHPEFSLSDSLQWTHGCLTFVCVCVWGGGILFEEPVRWFFGSVVGYEAHSGAFIFV